MYTHGLHEAYPKIYQLACILLTVPVSSAGCERVFSKLCLVKDELRSTMADEQLNGLMLMAVEKHSEGLGLADICGSQYVCSKTQKTETLEQTMNETFVSLL